MRTSAAMRQLIEGWEGCPSVTYHGGADRPGLVSGGYGHTGPDVGPVGTPVSKAQADAWLEADLAKFEAGVMAEIGSHPTTQGQLDALVSLAYNVGLGNEQHSTALAMHIAGEWQKAADAFLRLDHANGVENVSLNHRRAAEAQIYLDASPE